jgi:hypothetical protein
MPEMFNRLRHHRIALRVIAHVAERQLTLAARTADFCAHFFEVFGFAAGNENRSTAFCELLGYRFTYSGATAGYDGYFSFYAEWVLQA